MTPLSLCISDLVSDELIYQKKLEGEPGSSPKTYNHYLAGIYESEGNWKKQKSALKKAVCRAEGFRDNRLNDYSDHISRLGLYYVKRERTAPPGPVLRRLTKPSENHPVDEELAAIKSYYDN